MYHACVNGSSNRRGKKSSTRRRGVIIVLTAVLMVTMLGMIAFAVDVGYIVLGRTEIQRAVDAGALAGAGAIGGGLDVADATARQFVQSNAVTMHHIDGPDVEVQFGTWDRDNRVFFPSADPITSVRVVANRRGAPLFFGRVLQRDEFDLRAEAVATFQPRDIMVVLDFSASMNDDSELKHIGKLSRSEIEANLRQIYTELGSPTYGLMQWDPVYVASDDNRVVLKTLGLSSVPYPYPSGSWNDYINYVRSSGVISGAGYRKRYGGLTLVNYWLERQPQFIQTPDLWRTSEQPVTAVKDALSVFLSFIQLVDTDDQVGLVIYTSANGGAVLESTLTDDMSSIESITRQRQAGHYNRFTNIGAGLKLAREELENHGRDRSHKMIVLMTDGIANRPTNSTVARNYVRSEAQAAAEAEYPAVTVSLGAGADKDLMQEVADVTDGVHFNVPGGRSVSDYEDDLKDVFRQIAEARPLMLVK